MLLGGETNSTRISAEILPGTVFILLKIINIKHSVTGGKTFKLRHSARDACGIPDGETIVISGGYPEHNHVTRWNNEYPFMR